MADRRKTPGRRAADKMLGEWFWTDRWMGSSAFLLPLEPRGLYREMLSQAWLRGARLPNDHDAIRRAVGCTLEEWTRCWPRIEKYWRTDGDALVNDTQLEVYEESRAAFDAHADRAAKGAAARWNAQADAQADAQALLKHMLKQCPPDLDLDLDLSQEPERNTASSVTHESREPDDTSPIVLTYPVIGGSDPTWDLRQARVETWEGLYPGLDVRAECRKALAWVQSNQRKTAKGMPRFLNSWLSRAVDRAPARNVVAVNSKTAGNAAALARFAARGGQV